jgi:phosphocarrier protein HPr
MISRTVVVRCEHGLHGRVAASVVKLAHSHDSVVQIRCKGCPHANACSIIELLTLGAGIGTRLQVVADGTDEEAVVNAIADVFEQGDGI